MESENDRLTSEIQEAKTEIVTLKINLDELKNEKTSLENEVNKYKEIEATKDEEITTLAEPCIDVRNSSKWFEERFIR